MVESLASPIRRIMEEGHVFYSRNYSVLENQLLECCWALGEMENLTMDDQGTLWAELPIMS